MGIDASCAGVEIVDSLVVRYIFFDANIYSIYLNVCTGLTCRFLPSHFIEC